MSSPKSPGFVSLLLAAVLGGGVAGVIVFYASQPEIEPGAIPEAGRGVGRLDESDASLARSSGGLDSVSSGVDSATIAKLVARLGRLEDRVDSLAQQSLRVPVGPSNGPVEIAPEQVAQAMAELERQKLAAMTEEGLMKTAMRSFKSGQMEDAIVQLENLLERPLDDEMRYRARSRLATAHAKTGVEGCQRATGMLQQLIAEHRRSDRRRSAGVAAVGLGAVGYRRSGRRARDRGSADAQLDSGVRVPPQ